MKFIQAFTLMITRNLVVFFMSGFLFLFLGRNLPFQTLATCLLYISSFLFLLPCVLFLFSKNFKTLYIQSLRNSILVIFILGFTSVLFYFLQLDFLWNEWIPKNDHLQFVKDWGSLQQFFRISYLTLLSGLFVFSALFQASLKAVRSESNKVLEVRTVALNIIILFAILITLNYASKLRTASIDLTTIGRYSLSPEGSQLIKGINKEVKITGFYPFFHDIYREVELILQSINSQNSLITFSIVNAIREKNIADSKEVDRNGYVVFESLDPNELEVEKRNKSKRVRIESTNDLKTMEKDFVSAILNVSHEKKNIYFTTGHEEVTHEGKFTESLASLFRKELSEQNYEVKDLDPKTGFPPKIPEDAAAVVILGAKRTFAQQEKEVLKDYLFKKNGRVFLCLDPILSADFSFLLDEFKLKYRNAPILSKTSIQGKADMLIISNYDEHPITNSFVSLPTRHKFAIIPSTGYFEPNTPPQNKVKPTPENPNYSINYIVKTDSDSWIDKIKNSVHDSSKEPAQVRNIAFVAENKNSDKNTSLRLVAFGDTDFIRNKYFSWPGKHSSLSVNSIKWLLEDENIMGILPKSIEEGRVDLTNREENFVFYFLVFLWPLIVFGSAFLYLKYQKMKYIPKEAS